MSPIIFHYLTNDFHNTYTVRHILEVPDQCDIIVHSIVQRNEISDAINDHHVVPSATAVITLAEIICVPVRSSVHLSIADTLNLATSDRVPCQQKYHCRC